MKIISGILALIILVLVLVLVLCFALSNRQAVSIGMWPLQDAIEIQLYMVGLVPLLFGLLFGGVWGWLCGMPHRFRVRGLKKELKSLNDKIGELQAARIVRDSPTVSKKHFWERKK